MLEKVKNTIDLAMEQKKGANIKVEWETRVKPLKSAPKDILLTKYVVAVGRLGLEYQNLKSTKTKILNGDIDPNNPLPWGKWTEGYFPYLIEHTPKGTTELKYYLRIYFGSLSISPKVQYYLNGEPVTRKELEELVEKKYFSKTLLESTNADSMVTVGIDNIKKLNYVEL